MAVTRASPGQLSLFNSGPVESHDQGLFVPCVGLWLDARTPCPRAFVSHAHSDHISAHGHALLTRPTRRFFDLRIEGAETEFAEVGFNQPVEFGRSVVTLFPAGHILGSAQILVENEERIVYTGDLRLRPNPVTERTEIKPCDLLIIEATFGRPEYAFPPEPDLLGQLRHEIDQTLDSGRLPLVRAYVLGKAQESIALLNRLGYRVACEPVISQYNAVYAEFGFDPGPALTIADGGAARERRSEFDVLVAGTRRTLDSIRAAFPTRRMVFVSGWGVDAKARYRYGADVVIPLSDHCDYFDLIQYVEQAQPRRVLVTHGFPEFAHTLRKLGFDATSV